VAARQQVRREHAPLFRGEHWIAARDHSPGLAGSSPAPATRSSPALGLFAARAAGSCSFRARSGFSSSVRVATRRGKPNAAWSTATLSVVGQVFFSRQAPAARRWGRGSESRRAAAFIFLAARRCIFHGIPFEELAMSKYVETEVQAKQRRQSFTYHVPFGDQAVRYEQIRSMANQFAILLNDLCPPSRELSHAQTQLQGVVMFANASIACNEEHQVGL
jgi:hypothetical protein